MLESLREMLHKEPFEPFRIIMTSGKIIDVTNPDLVAFGETHITVYRAKSDHWRMLRLNQITAIEAKLGVEEVKLLPNED